MSVKYGNVKVIFRYCEGIDKPISTPLFPIVYDLSSDPGEKFNLMSTKLDMMWMFAPAYKALGEYKASVAQFPNIKPGVDFPGYDVHEDHHVVGAKSEAWEHHNTP